MTLSRGAHRGALTRRASAIQQSGRSLEDFQATVEFLIDRRKVLSELDAQIQQLIKDDNDLEADVKEAADVFFAAEKAAKECQGVLKKLQPPSTIGAQFYQVAA